MLAYPPLTMPFHHANDFTLGFDFILVWNEERTIAVVIGPRDIQIAIIDIVI
jgi:hypothetical protein